MNANDLMTKFRNHECAIVVSGEDDNMAFLEQCENFGVTWNSGDFATEFIPTYARSGREVYYFYNQKDAGMCWSGSPDGIDYEYIYFEGVVDGEQQEINVDSIILDRILCS